MPQIINDIEAYFNLKLSVSSATSPEDFMRYGRKEKDKNQYLLDGETLIGLKLRTNGINEFPFLVRPELHSLQALHLGENKLKKLDILKELTALQYLNIGDNKELNELTFGSTILPHLKIFDASDSGLKALSLPACPTLEKLDVSRNQLQSFSFTAACEKLVYLDLSGNKTLAELMLPKSFDGLTFLHASNCGLERLYIGGTLPALRVLDLENNRLKKWPEGFSVPDSLETLYLSGNQLEDISQTIIGGGARHNACKDVRNYLFSIEDKSKTEYLHQAKMILVGNGEVGKSSIRIKLLDEKAPLPTKEERTPGLDISINPYSIKDLPTELTGLDQPIDFQLNIWDFGGQSRYREVQQLFCSPKSLYLFVTAPDDKPEQNEEYVSFDYWMAMVYAISYEKEKQKTSPVIHIVNKIDLGRKDINQPEHNQLGNIERFLEISCEKLTNFPELRKAIREVLPKVGDDVFRDRFNKDWLKIKDDLQERYDENHITYKEYVEKICAPDLNESQAATWLRTLDRIGSVIYFGQNEKLQDWIILNPNWVKKAIFEVLDSGQVNPLTQSSFDKFIWRDYTTEEREKLLSLMVTYGLCYDRLNAFGKVEYIVPALLEDKPPDFEVMLPANIPIVNLRFRYIPFLPAGSVNKLMVRQKDHIFRNLMWKNNVILHDPQSEAYAHLWEDWRTHSIYLTMYGMEPSALYHLIATTLSELNTDFKDTKFLKQLDIKVEGEQNEKWLEISVLKDFQVKSFSFLWEKTSRLIDLSLDIEVEKENKRKPNQPTSGKKKVLFICSSPDGKNPLDFGRALKKIDTARQLADHREDFDELEIKTSVESGELLDFITKYQPDILHVSLHSSKSKGLYFEDAAGKVEPMEVGDFADLIETYCSDRDGKGKIETVVLSCCNSKIYGEAIHRFVDNIIATQDFFPSEAAIIYTEQFYKMLFNQKDISYAHRAAQNALKRKKYPDQSDYPVHEIPILLTNKGTIV